MPKNPLDKITWIDPDLLSANDYNPNHVFGPELDLLKRSLLEDGWTQPIVVTENFEIIDGFHRWTLARQHTDIQDLHDGQVPIVIVRGKSRTDRILATVRHNRARGSHGILAMGNIVRELQAAGLTEQQIEQRLGMEDEEQRRLAELRGSPELMGQDSFGAGWVPTREGLSAASRSQKRKKATYGTKV